MENSNAKAKEDKPIKAPKILKMHSKRKVAFRRLPFVGKTLWDVPATGGYCGGYETGRALATLFFKSLGEKDPDGFPPHYLGWIVSELMEKAEELGGKVMASTPINNRSPEYDSFRGQYLGFFNTLCVILEATARKLGTKLDDADIQTLLDQANTGLGSTAKH